MDLLFLRMTLALYLLATAGFVTYVLTAREYLRQGALAFLWAAFAGDAVVLVTRGMGGVAGTSFYDQVSLLVWLIVGLYLLLQRRSQLAVLGALVSPVAFLLSFSAYMAYAGVQTLPRRLDSAWLPAHVAPAFLGYASFVVAFFVSIVYLWQEKQLKRKQGGDLFRRLPSLETLDDLNYRFVAWGFALFTVGIVTGALLAKATWGSFWTWEPVEILSFLAWLLYAGLLHSRYSGWRGRRVARLTIIGFALLVFLFIGLLFPGHHASAAG